MIKLRGYLKPFALSILAAMLLLVIQAVCELNLPNLMSDIVNVGIQQGGVEDTSPEVISEDGMEFIETFMNGEQKRVVGESYELVNDPSLSATYPDAASQSIYVKRTLSAEEASALDDIFGTVTWTMIRLFDGLQGVSGMASMTAGSTGEGTGTDLQNIDFAQLYALQPMLQQLIAADPGLLENAYTQAQSVDEATRTQSAVMLSAGFYSELGCDLHAMGFAYIMRVGIIMLLVTLLDCLAAVAVGYYSSRVGAGVARDLRRDVFAKVSGFAHAELDRFSVASLITRSTNDVMQMQVLVQMGIRMLCFAPVMGIGATFMALSKSPSMAWILGLGVLVIVCALTVLLIVAMPKFRIIQYLIDKLNLVARETLNGLMVIKAFGREDFERKNFDRANTDVYKVNLFLQRGMVFMMPLLMIFMNALCILIIWVGAEQVAVSAMQVGDIIAYLQYAMQVVISFISIAMMFIVVPRAAISARRINEVLSTTPSIVDPVDPVEFDDLPAAQRGLVRFKDVSFRYEGAEEDALHNINFTAEPGKTTAFIGSTGAGKTTLLNLIPRFYDVTGGEVLVNGANVRTVRQQDLRARIGYVAQKSHLLSGTVAQNIAYGDPGMPAERVEEAARIAQATEFIDKLEVEERDEIKGAVSALGGKKQNENVTPHSMRGPVDEPQQTGEMAVGGPQDDTFSADGYNFEIAQGGGNVSGGQRQRLAIARALAIDPQILLFDDSFSALDFKTDAALRKALATHAKDATVIIVAQRVSTIMDANRIYVIDEGRVVGHGSHADLLRTCPAYYEIASSQLSGEELAGGGDRG